DRVRDLAVSPTPGSRPTDFSLRAFVERSFGIYQDAVEEVVLRIHPHGAEEAMGWRFHPTQTLEPQADGAVIARFQAAGMREIAWHLFTWGDKVEILAPVSLRATLIDGLQTALARHQATAALPDPPARLG
ncbi:MAG TPA: WYL domain-containing protein, partial [Caulobacteraceae bacterium]|nr:WYL domain-containing protein [Caulobacteraceae bacterium]